MLAHTFGEPCLYNRKTAPRTKNYPEIINELLKLPQGLILDGELIAVAECGRQDFHSLLRRDNAAIYKPVAGIEICYAVFDILYESAKDITKLPLFERQKILQNILSGCNGVIRQVDSFSGIGSALYKAAQDAGLEGIVAKKLTSVYIPATRSKDWLKIKCPDYVRP